MRQAGFRRRAAGVILTAAVAVSGLLIAFAFPPSSEPLYRGIDVSEWQGGIDFQKVESSGVQMVYIRACLGGDYTDSRFLANAAAVRKTGLSYGFYHYVTAQSTAEAKQQAQYFAELIRSEPYTCRPAMDYERFGSLSAAQIDAVAKAYLTELERLTGVRPVIYSNASNAKHTFDKSLSVYPLWVAHWGVSEPGDNGKWSSWAGFQYSSTGRVSGISGAVDLDWFTAQMKVPQTPPSSAAPASSRTPSSSPPASSSPPPASSTPPPASSTPPPASSETASGPSASSAPSQPLDSSSAASSHASSQPVSSDSGGGGRGGVWIPIVVGVLIALLLILLVWLVERKSSPL